VNFSRNSGLRQAFPERLGLGTVIKQSNGHPIHKITSSPPAGSARGETPKVRCPHGTH
jgi:hypothetical protein